MSTPPKPFDYAAFIARLRELLESPHFTSKPGVPLNAKNPGFVEWKHKVIFAITQIEELGYKVHSDIRTRLFAPVWTGRGTEAERTQRESAHFQRALHETDIELRNLVEHFDQFGAPALNGQQLPSVPRTFDYPAFIAELRVLRDSFANPPTNHRNHLSPEFQRWKHELCDLIARVESACGVGVNTAIRGRRFQVMALGSITPREQLEAFNQAHTETMIELDTILSNYEKYGDPTAKLNGAPVIASPEEPPVERLKWNKEATLRWYVENTPATTMMAVLLAFFAVFSAGYGVAQWKAELPKTATVEALGSVLPQSNSASQPTISPSRPAPVASK